MCIVIVFGLIIMGIFVMSIGLPWTMLIGICLIALAALVSYFVCIHRCDE